MCKGIDESSVFVVCVTHKYMLKVGGRNLADNCKKEFMYAEQRLTAAKMVPVVMEVSVCTPADSTDPIPPS